MKIQTITHPALADLFANKEDQPCEKGLSLLLAFADRRPADFAFISPADLENLDTSAFSGITEWELFREHYASSGLCVPYSMQVTESLKARQHRLCAGAWVYSINAGPSESPYAPSFSNPFEIRTLPNFTSTKG